MSELHREMQTVIDLMDACIKQHTDADMTLESIAGAMGYSAFYFSRKFREITGMQFRDYLRLRRLAFAVKDVDACVEAVRAAGYEITVEPNDIVIPSNPPLPARIAFCAFKSA